MRGVLYRYIDQVVVPPPFLGERLLWSRIYTASDRVILSVVQPSSLPYMSAEVSEERVMCMPSNIITFCCVSRLCVIGDSVK